MLEFFKQNHAVHNLDYTRVRRRTSLPVTMTNGAGLDKLREPAILFVALPAATLVSTAVAQLFLES